jgi:hypothetical protein
MVVVVSGSGRREATYFNQTGGEGGRCQAVVGGCGEGVGFVFVWKMGGRVQRVGTEAATYFRMSATAGLVLSLSSAMGGHCQVLNTGMVVVVSGSGRRISTKRTSYRLCEATGGDVFQTQSNGRRRILE